MNRDKDGFMIFFFVSRVFRFGLFDETINESGYRWINEMYYEVHSVALSNWEALFEVN